MAFKKIPSSKTKLPSHLLNLSIFFLLVDGYTDNKIIRTTNTNNNNNTNIVETTEKRSLLNLLDMPSKLDFSTLQSIAHQTGSLIFFLK